MGSAATPLKPARDTNFELIVLNASQHHKPLDIQVHIDGRLAVDEAFSSEAPASSPIMGIPPHKRFQFQLTPGSHSLRATSKTAATSREERFDIADKHWALVGYDYWSDGGTRPAPGQFEFQIQSTPIRFQ